MQKNASIRRAFYSDLAELVVFGKELADFHHALDPALHKPGAEYEATIRDYLAKYLRARNTRVYMGEVDDQSVGYFIGMIHPTTPDLVPRRFGHFSQAYVREGFRGRGLASLAAEAFRSWFQGRGVEFMHLGVDARNTDAIAAWEHLGFEPSQMRMLMRV